MEYEFYETISSAPEKPEIVDTTSSALYVYERKDIEPYQEKGFEEAVLWDGWKYKERKIPREQWYAYYRELQSIKENQDTLMLAIADLYEMQLGG